MLIERLHEDLTWIRHNSVTRWIHTDYCPNYAYAIFPCWNHEISISNLSARSTKHRYKILGLRSITVSLTHTHKPIRIEITIDSTRSALLEARFIHTNLKRGTHSVALSDRGEVILLEIHRKPIKIRVFGLYWRNSHQRSVLTPCLPSRHCWHFRGNLWLSILISSELFNLLRFELFERFYYNRTIQEYRVTVFPARIGHYRKCNGCLRTF